MRLDHVSYVASHDQISDVVHRIGSKIGTIFVDGGIHPKFGTRNFTAPLLNGQYIEVVCPLNHPATETSTFGQLVKSKLNLGGGWLAWVLNWDLELSKLTNNKKKLIFELGQRKLPDGKVLVWNQIGLEETLNDLSQPYYVEWLSAERPHMMGLPKATLTGIEIDTTKNQLLQNNLLFKSVKKSNPLIEFKVNSHSFKNEVNCITFSMNNKEVQID